MWSAASYAPIRQNLEPVGLHARTLFAARCATQYILPTSMSAPRRLLVYRKMPQTQRQSCRRRVSWFSWPLQCGSQAQCSSSPFADRRPWASMHARMSACAADTPRCGSSEPTPRRVPSQCGQARPRRRPCIGACRRYVLAAGPARTAAPATAAAAAVCSSSRRNWRSATDEDDGVCAEAVTPLISGWASNRMCERPVPAPKPSSRAPRGGKKR